MKAFAIRAITATPSVTVANSRIKSPKPVSYFSRKTSAIDARMLAAIRTDRHSTNSKVSVIIAYCASSNAIFLLNVSVVLRQIIKCFPCTLRSTPSIGMALPYRRRSFLISVINFSLGWSAYSPISENIAVRPEKYDLGSIFHVLA